MSGAVPRSSTAFVVELAGELDQARLDRLRKLLDLRPQGRLTDTEDQGFGYRRLRTPDRERAELELIRHSEEMWRLELWAGNAPLSPSVVATELADVLAVAREVGFAVRRVLPAEVATVSPGAPISLPDRVALRVRVDGHVTIDQIETVRRILDLCREGGGLSGHEYGWRYVRRGATGRVLLQLLEHYPDSAEVVLWYDGPAPDADTVEGVRLQVGAALAKAGLTVAAAEPQPMPDGATWERLGAPAVGAPDLAQAWRRLGVTADTPVELKRGLLLAAIMSSAWQDRAELLRRQAFEYVIGVDVTAEGSVPNYTDRWL